MRINIVSINSTVCIANENYSGILSALLLKTKRSSRSNFVSEEIIRNIVYINFPFDSRTVKEDFVFQCSDFRNFRGKFLVFKIIIIRVAPVQAAW